MVMDIRGLYVLPRSIRSPLGPCHERACPEAWPDRRGEGGGAMGASRNPRRQPAQRGRGSSMHEYSYVSYSYLYNTSEQAIHVLVQVQTGTSIYGPLIPSGAQPGGPASGMMEKPSAFAWRRVSTTQVSPVRGFAPYFIVCFIVCRSSLDIIS